MPDPAIVIHNLHKEFILPQHKLTSLKQVFVNLGRKNLKKKQKVLDGINLKIDKGDFFGIVGRNGSGKSTLLKILAGVYSPTAGSVEVRGSLTPFIELGVGFNPELSGRDNVYLNGALLGFSHKEMDVMYDDIVSFAELGEFMDQKLKNYSSGMQVRLAFSVAVRAKSDILLLDEVLAVGDAAFQQKCFNHFEELKQQKRTVIFISHDMTAVRRFCSRAVYIKEGKIIHEGTPSDVADIYTMENIDSTPGTNEPVEEQVQSRNKIKARVAEQTDKDLTVRINYQSDEQTELYIGMSILKEGVSVAEITTPPNMQLPSKGKVRYRLDTTMFNGAGYHVGVGLFKVHNRELIAAGNEHCSFVIKGSDPTKGGALNLPHTWELE